MANEDQFDEVKARVIKIRQVQAGIKTRRDKLESKSLEDAQQASQSKLDAILAAQNVADDDIRDLIDLESDLQERVAEEREVQALERDFQGLRQQLSGRAFGKP